MGLIRFERLEVRCHGKFFQVFLLTDLKKKKKVIFPPNLMTAFKNYTILLVKSYEAKKVF